MTNITHHLITSEAEFTALEKNWDALLGRSGIPSPFLTWSWVHTWWREYGSKSPQNELAILLIKQEDRLVGIIPGYVQTSTAYLRKTRVFQFLGSEYESSDYLEPIVDPQLEPNELAAAFRYLSEKKSVDIFTFVNVLENRPFVIQTGKLFNNLNSRPIIKHHRVCPYITINRSWDEYLQALSKNMRYNIRRRTRKLEKEFHPEFDWLQNDAEIEDTINELFRLHSDRFESKSRKSIFVAEKRQGFHQQIAREFNARDILRLFRLKINGKAVALLYCYEYGNQLFYFQAGMDPAWESYSPGLVLMAKVIQYAHDKGLVLFDFMRGDESYKFKWTQQVRNMVVIDLPVTAAGKTAIRVRELGLTMKNAVKTLLPEKTWNNLKRLAGS